MEFDNLATVEALAKLPPEAPKIAEPKRSAWTAPLRAVPAAAAEAMAGAAEIGTAAYRSLQQMDEGGAAGRRQRDRFGIQPVRGETEVSRSLRNVAESYGPDPVTAGEAERLVFGLTRGIGKAVAYGLTTGPAAPFLFGADEGLTTMDQLQRQGVDTATAAKAGGVAAAVNAAGFLIPVAGKTVAGTIGLGTLSGPASFVAQQASTREILRAADYHQIADQFDPIDPAGLGMSLLPFGFGAWAMRGRRGAVRPAEPARPVEPARPAADVPAAAVAPESLAVVEAAPKVAADPVRPAALPEHVDAAMVHNLTLAADHAEAMHSPPMESLADFSARVMPPASDASPARAGPDPFLTFLKANGGVNFADKFDITGESNAIRLNRGGVFTKAGKGLDDLAVIAESEGWLPPGSTADVDGGVPQLRDMLQRSMSGERIKPLAQQFDDIAARHMATSEQLRTEALAHRLEVLGVDPAPARGDADVMAAYLDQHEPRLLRQALADIAEPDPTPAAQQKEVATTPFRESPDNQARRIDAGYTALVEVDAAKLAAAFKRDRGEPLPWSPERLARLRDVTTPLDDYPRVFIGAYGSGLDVGDGRHRISRAAERGQSITVAMTPEDAKAAAGSGWVKNSDTTPAPGDAPASKPLPPQAQAAVDAIRAMRESGQPVAQFLADATLPDDVRNLVIGLAEARDGAAGARMLDDFARTVAAQPKRAPVDVAADVVEAARAGKDVTPAEGTSTSTGDGPDAALIQSVRTRGDQVVREAPDLVVGLTEDGRPITAREALERIRREAQDGTDDTLGAADAPLLDVAVQCALSVGE